MKQILLVLCLMMPCFMSAQTVKGKKHAGKAKGVITASDMVIGVGKASTVGEASQIALQNATEALAKRNGGVVGHYQVMESIVSPCKKGVYTVTLYVRSIDCLSEEEKAKIDFNEDRYKRQLEYLRMAEEEYRENYSGLGK